MKIFSHLPRPLRLVRRAYKRFLTASPRVKIAVSICLVLLAALLYLLGALCFLSRGEVALAALRVSYQREAVCRDACWEERAADKQSVSEELARRPQGRLSRRLRRYFLDEGEDIGFREALLLIYQEAFGRQNMPDFLRDYAANPAANARLVARLVSLFDPASFSEEADINPLDYYFTLLQAPISLAVAEAAILGISRYPDWMSAYREEQVGLIRQLILSPETDDRLRPALVMLLSDYYQPWPDEVSETLRLTYAASELDAISRAFSADLLNRFEPQGGPEGRDWPVPEISEAAWSNYYER